MVRENLKELLEEVVEFNRNTDLEEILNELNIRYTKNSLNRIITKINKELGINYCDINPLEILEAILQERASERYLMNESPNLFELEKSVLDDYYEDELEDSLNILADTILEELNIK
ncbi:hypothetical protein [Vagococcus sp. CY53-2]|uniref:hypothetical protein n=1 Tax=Vagococcus sp. CY53-2 TaxID=2925780 RepID=UPI001F512742|nr:hypothetical protein [Vagococcus sp. CY53-2]MCI0130036.1 hypothetical protein [Vagococcus sp. CY53-2]